LTTDIDHDSITNTHNLTTDIDHDSITNTHNLTTDIDHDSLTNVHQDVNTDASPTFAGLTLDDGAGDSPVLTLQCEGDKTLTFQKMDAGEANIINNEGQINIKPSNDTDDYLVLSTATNKPQIGFAWSSGGGGTDLDTIVFEPALITINSAILANGNVT
jgi:hypothetical protein